MSAPGVVVALRVEAGAYAYLDVTNSAEERRVLLDLEERDLIEEITEALVRLFTAIDDCEGTS